MKNLYLIIIVLFLTSCSASWHFRKALKKDPALFNSKPDTTVQVTPRPMPAANLALPGLVFNHFYLDTFKIINEKDSIIFKILADSTGTNIEVDCPDCADSVKIINVPYPRPVYIKPTFWESLEYAGYLIGAIIILFILIKALYKFWKPM